MAKLALRFHLITSTVLQPEARFQRQLQLSTALCRSPSDSRRPAPRKGIKLQIAIGLPKNKLQEKWRSIIHLKFTLMRLLFLAEQQQKSMKNYIANCLFSSLPDNTHYHISLEVGFPFTLLSTIMSTTSVQRMAETTVALKCSFYPLSNQIKHGLFYAWQAQF